MTQKYKITQNQILIAVGLILVGGLIGWVLAEREYGNGPLADLDSMRSEANDDYLPITRAMAYPHWPSGKVSVLNSANAVWGPYLTSAVQLWEFGGSVKYTVMQGDNKEPCQYYMGKLNFCSINEPDTPLLAGGAYSYNNKDGHILEGVIMFNDAMQKKGWTPAKPEEISSSMMCRYLGFGSGVRDRDYPSQSCMVHTFDWNNVGAFMEPDSIDYTWMRKALSHKEPRPIPTQNLGGQAVSLSQLANNLGANLESFSDGKLQYSDQLIGDGITLRTFVVKNK